MSLPRLLSYNNVKPRGVQTEHKLMRFTPLTSFNNYITNDIVRFWIPFLRGFWDPYKSYIEIEVEVDAADFPYGTGIQVDNSASSFISEMTLFVDSEEIERIQEYDTIAAQLHDLMYMPNDKFGKEYEGFGYAGHTSLGTNVDTRRIISNSYARCMRPVASEMFGTTAASTAMGASGAAYDTLNMYVSGYHPEKPIYITPEPVSYPVVNMVAIEAINSGGYDVNTTLGIAPGGYRFARVPVQQAVGAGTSNNINLFGGGGTDVASHTAYNIFIRAHPQAFQYMFLFADAEYSPFITSTTGTTLPFNEKNVACSRPWVESHCESTMYGVQHTESYNFSLYPSAGYAEHSFATGTISNVANVDMAPNYNVSRVNVNGYTQAFSEELTNGSYEPLFTPAHGETWIHNGGFLRTDPLKTNKKVFQIPIISSLFGVLIPAESYELLPMSAFKNLMLEFRLNEYAMFTSGYEQTYLTSPVNTDSQPMTDIQMLQRKWKINRFEIWGQVYMFDDFINSATESALSAGITISSSGWNIGPRFSLASTASIENTWQINTGHESLRTLCFRIQSDDYEKYTFCRKHYYYSGNITSLQIKIANTYIPPQPIEGHSGNIICAGSEENNVPFILELHKTFGKLFNVGASTYINSTNFAVNDRPYNIENTAAYRNAVTGAVTNIDTAYGLPLFHENRCVGRAVFAFDLEALPGEPETISGLDTTKYRPFEVVIDSETGTHNGRDSTLVFILNYDVIYVLHNDSPPTVYGRGSS